MVERTDRPYSDPATPDSATRGPSTQPRRAEDSIGDLVKELSSETSTLMRQEVALAKTELKQEAAELSQTLKQEATKAGKASGLLVAGGVVGLVAFIILMMAASWGLAAIMPTGWAFAIVGIVLAVVAAVVAAAGRNKLKKLDTSRLQQFDPTPRQTVETLEEDKEWARNQVK